jgi:hypothetical protein
MTNNSNDYYVKNLPLISDSSTIITGYYSDCGVSLASEPEFYSDSQTKIARECDAIKEMLLDKNRKYGDAALSPLQIFCKKDAETQLRSRIDDKLSRIKNDVIDEDEDPIKDLIGYLILLRVKQREKDVRKEGRFG